MEGAGSETQRRERERDIEKEIERVSEGMRQQKKDGGWGSSLKYLHWDWEKCSEETQ